MLGSLLAGNRGSTPQEFIVFLVVNVGFIHVITLLWSELLEKPIDDYRIYFAATFSLWIALSAVVNHRFGKKSLKGGIAHCFISAFTLLLTQGAVAYIYLFFVVGFVAPEDFFYGLILGYLYCFPVVVILSLFRSVHFTLKQIIRIVWRISFFLTPVIWIPFIAQVGGKSFFLDWNPLYFGFSQFHIFFDNSFYRPKWIEYYFFIIVPSVILLLAFFYILKRRELS